MLSKRMSTITPSYTIGISTKVNTLKSQGLDIYDLSIGEPDFMMPAAGGERVIEALKLNKTKYDLVAGLMVLRSAICDKLRLENNVAYETSDIVVSSGAKNAITNALMATLDPGDEIIIPAPYWTSYPEMVKLCLGIPVIVNTDKKNNFKLTVDQLKSAVTEKTKLLLINNPSNPTGAVYSKDELLPLVEFCVEENIMILADEIYEKICYDQAFVSIPSLSEKAKDITILVNGFSKSAAMTGLRLGYTASNPTLAKAMSMLQGHLISHPCTLSQWAGYGCLTSGEEEMQRMLNEYKSRRDHIIPLVRSLPNSSFITPQGAFYLFIDLGAYRDKFLKSDSFSVAFSDALLSNYNVAVVPGIAFGHDDYIRISYATKLSYVVEGLSRIRLFLESL